MIRKLFLTLFLIAVLLFPVTALADDAQGWPLSREGYTLEQVVVLSRHSIRSPLSGKGSVLGEITPHEWFAWSSAPSELSLRGGVLETEMGQYFRKWLEVEGLIPENYRPEGNEVRVYANAKQRTIATSQYFSAGFLPTANLLIEYHAEYDKMDPVFSPVLTFVSDTYRDYAEAQMRSLFSEKIAGLEDNYALLTDVTDMEETEAFRNGTLKPFRTDDTAVILEAGAEPGMSGSLKTGCSAADALVLQYYEEPDELKAAFGHKIGFEEWRKISEIKDLYVDFLFAAPLIAVNVAHPLLEEIRDEITEDGRLFTFLCGHDSNIASVLAALDVEEYILPDAIEVKTPIGCKLVFTKWSGPDGKALWGADLVYLKTDQLRGMPLLGQGSSPAVFPVTFAGLERTPEGLYSEADLLARFDQAIAAYDTLEEEYADIVPAEVAEESTAGGE